MQVNTILRSKEHLRKPSQSSRYLTKILIGRDSILQYHALIHTTIILALVLRKIARNLRSMTLVACMVNSISIKSQVNRRVLDESSDRMEKVTARPLPRHCTTDKSTVSLPLLLPAL